ncbi:hypothetical protein [Halobiforma nitratireducens]|uniref:Uncharacterized protein n=1 Tax=Halobiforma nitratireducens JCM 10879 TaxID=1227454 RepID=M0MAZ7_9EURY|nr:hypothetical protein [Halobiforma nitratireducens]EMA41819.1 hypothetical protein C446_05870 [Halobiforma nitratireducens JCM 10879]
MVRTLVVAGVVVVAVILALGVASAAGTGHEGVEQFDATDTVTMTDPGFESAAAERAGTFLESIEPSIVQSDSDRPDPDPIPFVIERINGEDPDQVNEVAFHRGESIVVELEGIDPGEKRVMASLNGTDLGRVDENGTVYRDDADLERGEYTLTLSHTDLGETESASTDIEIVRTEADRPEVGPADFSIASVNGEDPDQVNEVAFSHGQPIEVELEGIDPAETLVTASIGDEDVGRVGADGTIHDADATLTTGTHTLTISHRDATVTTELEIVATESDRDEEIDESESGSGSEGDVDDGPGSADEQDDGSKATPVEDRDADTDDEKDGTETDGAPGFGLTSAVTALVVGIVTLLCRSQAFDSN